MQADKIPTGAEFYARLLESLRDAGLPTTQVEIARLLNVSQGSVSKWARSVAYPSRPKGLHAAKLCKVSFAWLYLGQGEKKAEDVDEITWRLMEAFDALPEQEKRELVEYAQFKASLHKAQRSEPDNPE